MRLFEAARFAVEAHKGQVRRWVGEDYVCHPARVAARIMLLPDVTEEMAIAAFLHDVVEDCDFEVEDIEARFGPVVARYVDGLTDEYTKENYPDLNRAARKKLEAERLAQESVEVRNIKLADIHDNLASLEGDPSDSFAKVFLAEKDHILTVIGDDVDPGILADVERVAEVLRKRIEEPVCD